MASWADHRIEHYPLRQSADSALVSTERQVLFEGGNDFRPVGLAIAPDGTVLFQEAPGVSSHAARIWMLRPGVDTPVAVAGFPPEDEDTAGPAMQSRGIVDASAILGPGISGLQRIRRSVRAIVGG